MVARWLRRWLPSARSRHHCWASNPTANCEDHIVRPELTTEDKIGTRVDL